MKPLDFIKTELGSIGMIREVSENLCHPFGKNKEKVKNYF